MLSRYTITWRKIVILLFSPKLYGLPFFNRFRKLIYQKVFKLGRLSFVGSNVILACPHIMNGKLIIGDNVDLGDNLYIDYTGDVVIGSNVTLSRGTVIYSHNHDFLRLASRVSNDTFPEAVSIEKGAWIGGESVILPGVSIGQYAVVGAGSVVTKDVPPYTVVAGNPAKTIRKLEQSKIYESEE